MQANRFIGNCSVIRKGMMLIAIADENEILEFFTDVMRGECFGEENIKFSDSFKAAELLGKYYGIFSGGIRGGEGDVIIVDSIREKSNPS
jgi:hypothetical protein